MTRFLLLLLLVAGPKSTTVTITTEYQLRGPARLMWIKAVSQRTDGALCQVRFLPLRWDKFVEALKPLYLNINPNETRELNFDEIGKFIGNDMAVGESFVIDPVPPGSKPCAVVKIQVER